MRGVRRVGLVVARQYRTFSVSIVQNKHQYAFRNKSFSSCAGIFYGNKFTSAKWTQQEIFQSRGFHTSHVSQGMDISSIELAGHCTRYMPDWTLHECKLKCNNEQRPGEIEFFVRYIDTAASLDPAVREKMPVVVATHGSPGSYKDLVLVIEPLIDKGARLVLPNMPGTTSFSGRRTVRLHIWLLP